MGMSDRAVETSLASFQRTADRAPDGARIPIEVRVTTTDPYTAYRRARGDDPSFCYETGGGKPGWGYFGVDPDEFVTVGADDPAIPALADVVSDEALARGDCDVPYPGGVFGWLSYDAVRELEDLPSSAVDDRGLPHLQAGVYSTIAAWEAPFEAGDSLRIIATPRVTDDASVESVYRHGRDAAMALAREVMDGDPAVGDPPVGTGTATFTSDTGPTGYAENVRAVKQYVRDGDTFQANISHRLTAPAAVHPVEVFDAIRSVNPAPYASLLEFPGVDIVSASPELLVERDGDRLVTEPIAGTRPRGETPEEDDELEAELRENEKERAEHAMLVDLERNDLGKVSDYGTVDVTEYRRVERYAEVMHLESVVEGRLHEDQNLATAIAAVFPGGTITGAPKPRTMAIIDELEATRRGPYTGSAFVVGWDSNAILNILIRTLVRYEDEYHLRVGGGVVHDSVPMAEYEETLDKARGLVNAVDAALDAQTKLTVEEDS